MSNEQPAQRPEGPVEATVGPDDIENIGDDTYRLMARGHHDVHAFMRAAREAGYDWPLGMPRHIWFRAVPDNTGNCTCRYYEAKPHARGAFAVTYVHEAYGEDSYEALTYNAGYTAKSDNSSE